MGTVSSDTFTLDFAITFVVMIIVGGMGSMGGALLGAAVVTLAPFGLRMLAQLEPGLDLAADQPAGGAERPLRVHRAAGPAVPAARCRADPRRPGHEASADSAPRRPTTAPVSTRDRRPPDEPGTGLVISDLRVTYRNGARALDGAGMTVGAGEVVAVVGRNGAGKSTLLRSISGFFGTEQVSSAGSVRFAGAELVGPAPLRTSRLGIVLVPERDKVFPSLTVADHISHLGGGGGARRHPGRLADPRRRWRSPAGLLSGGERSCSPRDGRQPGTRAAAGRRDVAGPRARHDRPGRRRYPPAARGPPDHDIIVEQNVAVASALAERVYRLDGGRLALEGDAPVAGEVAR